jgi:hypothetical protein
MTNVNNSAIVQPSADPTAPPAITPDVIVAQLRALRDVIPNFTQLPTPQARSFRVVAKGTDPEFVQTAINSVEESVNVQQAIGRTPEELRKTTADAQIWTAVEDAARSLLNGIVAANLVRHFQIGTIALAVYSIATRLARQPEHANLLTNVQTMKRLNKFGNKKRVKAAAPAPVTPPATAPQQPTGTQPVTASQQPKSAS